MRYYRVFSSPVVSMDSNVSGGRIIALDGLRGLACLFVLVHHYFTGVAHFRPESELGRFFWEVLAVFFLSGVDLFYVLSGFLVGGIIIDFYKSPNFLKVFFIRRVCRILPVYYVLVLSYIVLPPLLFNWGVLGTWANTWLLEKPIPTWSYLTFMQSYVMGLEGASGAKWLAITWSVSVEEQFYLIMPFIFMLLGARRAAMVTLAGILLAPMVRHYLFENVGFYAGYMFFPGRMDTIFWGVLLAFMLRSESCRRIASHYSWLLMALAGLAFASVAAGNLKLLDIPIFARYTALAIFYFVVMWSVLEQRIIFVNALLRTRFLTFTGMISYAAYMVHQLVNGLVHGLLFSSKPQLNSIAQIMATVLSVVIVYVLCYLSYRYFEGPILRAGKRVKYERTNKSPSLEVDVQKTA